MRTEGALVADAGQAAVLGQLIGVQDLDGQSGEPARLSHRHGQVLASQLAECSSVAPGDSSSALDGARARLIVRRQEDAIRRLDGEEVISSGDIQAVGHLLRKSGADRPAGPAKANLFQHGGTSGGMATKASVRA